MQPIPNPEHVVDWDKAQQAIEWIRCQYRENLSDGMDEHQALLDAIGAGTAHAIDAMLVLWASGCLWDAVTEYMEDIEAAAIG